MKENKYVLGLDLGVGSVGWAVVNKEDGKIIDKGVRLFSEINSEENLKRRGFRHTRRLLRRKEFRLYRTRRILLEMGLIDSIDFKPLDNPYEIRCKGLNQKLSYAELATAILHLMKRNGFRYDIADDEENGNKHIKEEYLCQHQMNEWLANGKVRGINNKYHFSLYKKEFEHLLEVQDIDEKYAIKLKEIFEKRRDYSEGPGGANSPTPYGRYLEFGAKPINLIDKMRGHCSIYQDQPRAPKMCPSAELFNFLNDLNNLTVDNRFVTHEQKENIFETYILGKGKITVKQLCTELGVSEEKITGFRLDSKDRPILTEFKSLKKVMEICKKEGIPEYAINSYDDFKILDGVFEILTKTKIIEERERDLSSISSIVGDKYVKAFAKISGVSNYHSLSLKAIYEMIDEMFKTNKNSQQIVVTLSRDNNDIPELKMSKDIIASPVVVKSSNQAFKIIKAATKKYGVFESIVIEMTRSKNSKDEADKIKKGQARRLEEKEQVLELIKNYVTEPNGKIIEKVLLYKEQEGKSIYSGKPMDLKDVILNPNAYEIDHIIPYSISLDNSRSNKVLVYANENHIKDQRTPHQVFMKKPSDWWSEDEYVASVRTLYKNHKISSKKVDNLLFTKDINADDVREDFINRNLNDTSYITSNVLSTLKQYYKYNNIPTKVFVVNGATTRTVRMMGGLVKNRDMYCHHAVDACIIASFSQSTYLSKALTSSLYDSETGEIYTLDNDKDIFGPVVSNVAKQLIEFDPIKDYKFSYKVDTKANRSISDKTLYGARLIDGELKVIKSYNILDKKDGETVANNIKNNKDVDKLLIVKNDPNTFALLCKIVESYPNEANPFATYVKEHGPIRKMSKKPNSPIVSKLKYVESSVGVHQELSHKYPNSTKRVPLKLQLSPYRMDLYQGERGDYKFVTIRYADIKQKGDVYRINTEWYEAQKEKKKIDDSYVFLNTYNKSDIIEISKDTDTIKYVFMVVKDDKTNVIELDSYGRKKEKRLTETIGKKITNIRKLSTDILGNTYEVKGEKLKLEWK